MKPILKHLQGKKVTPIMWDDMMRYWPLEYLKGKELLDGFTLMGGLEQTLLPNFSVVLFALTVINDDFLFATAVNSALCMR